MVTIHEEGATSASAPEKLRLLIKNALDNLGMNGDVALVFVSEARGGDLNKEYRGKNCPTNVLSFPSSDDSVLGDIVITESIVSDEAPRLGRSVREHEQRLIIHGLLHLVGYLHDTDEGAEEMEKRENDIYTLFIRM